MPRLTVRNILLAITAGLTLMVAVLSARALIGNFERLSQTQELREAIVVSDHLFDATGKVSMERDLALAMLQAADAETLQSLTPLLAESRRQTDVAVSAALIALDAQGLEELGQIRGKLEEHYASLRALRERVDAAFALPVARREAGLNAAWEGEATALMRDAESLWIAFIRPFTNIDATVTQHLRYRHMVRTITDYAGRERSIIGQILTQQAPATAEQTAELLRAQGVLELAWSTSRLLAEQSGLYQRIALEYEDAESHYATLGDMTRASFYVPGVRRSEYPIEADLWFELSSQAAESLDLLRQASEAATRAHLDEMVVLNERAIALQILIALIALALCVACFWVILARIIRPINSIVDALTRTTRGEDVVLDQDARSDEIGELVQVLGAFQSEVSVRRQAEAKAHAQLERLALLHKISRAIGERQDLGSILNVALGNVETQLPAAFACMLMREPGDDAGLRVMGIGSASAAYAAAMELQQGAIVPIDNNGLSRCMSGRLVYEPDTTELTFPFPQRLAAAGLRSLVAAPLQVESQVFGAMIVARTGRKSFSSGECEFLRQLSEHVALASHQAQLNAALQRAYDDLRQTQDAVMQQERLKALGQMASGIAHDINNALSPIALYTESLLLTEPALTEAGRNKLQVVQRAIDDASRTIARMNDFYRKRDRSLALAPIEPKTLIAQVLDLTQARWRDMAQLRGDVIDVRSEVSPDLEPVLGVENELREALTNLVFNAIDAMPNGGTLTVRAKAANTDGARAVHIEVSDSGVGMNEETRRRCLEPFYTTKGERGTGLGLAMVYGAVQRHGGDLEIDSTPGQGTTVRLILAAASQSASAAPSVEARPLKRLKILLVDDDPILLRSLREVLETDGHSVTAVNAGVLAVEAVTEAKQSQPFDAVITDLGMPNMDGRRVASAVKHVSPQTAVIMLTGWGERLKAEEDCPADVDRILSKPPKLREVRAALAEACTPSKEARTA